MASDHIIALGARSYRTLLRQAPEAEIFGGQIYDAVIARCGLIARVSALLTFNPRHFAWLSDRSIEVIVPGNGSPGGWAASPVAPVPTWLTRPPGLPSLPLGPGAAIAQV